MSTSNQTVISQAIANALRHIPVVWPLQQFIATNPCWDLIDQSMDEVTSTIQKLTHNQTTLAISDYWQYYQAGKINDAAITQAIAASYSTMHKNVEKTAKDDTVSLYQRLLHHFMTQKDQQSKLIKCIESKNATTNCHQSILLSSQAQSYGYDNALDTIQSECLSWLAQYFNPTRRHQKTLTQINKTTHQNTQKTSHFFNFWRTVTHNQNNNWRVFLSSYSDDVNVFVEAILSDLSIPTTSINQYLLEIAWQLKGWLGYIKWHKNYPNNPYYNQSIEAIEIIALWLAYEAFWLNSHQGELTGFQPRFKLDHQPTRDNAINTMWLDYINNDNHHLTTHNAELINNLAQLYPLTQHSLSWLWQLAYEISYQEPLYQTLLANHHQLYQQQNKPTHRPQESTKAQWVFCIDVRSEGFRRHLEHVDHYDTFGFAGFFGFVYQLYDKDNQKLTCQCPALIEPNLLIKLSKATSSFCHRCTKTLSTAIAQSKQSLLSPFALYELIGLWFAITLTLKNYTNSFLRWLKQLCFSKTVANAKNNHNTISPHLAIDNIDIATLTESAKGLLQGIGLTSHFSDYVIICGHSATTENNPYQAAFDCGACGGNAGFSNALLACQVLNKPAVRADLATQGIVIPQTTLFIAACHDTTTDQIHWYDHLNVLSEQQQQQLHVIKQHAISAGKSLQKERLQALPGDSSVIRRSRHWAELIPEWGLANNAAMIIAPRKLTQSLNLQRRVFLHCYESDSDPDGSILESIFLGPVIVAHWINSQYYFSAVAPDHYSSGNKAIHNVLPYVGVIEGNQSDLKYGLPLQSVFYQAERMHEPLRLSVFVDADTDKIDAILNKHAELKSLVDGQWLWIKSLRQ